MGNHSNVTLLICCWQETVTKKKCVKLSLVDIFILHKLFVSHL